MGLGWKELVIVLVIVLLVFGTKRLSNLGGDLGAAIKGFKKGMKDEAKPEALDQTKSDGDKP
jgi:sec-independent protein translocase protein TatA